MTHFTCLYYNIICTKKLHETPNDAETLSNYTTSPVTSSSSENDAESGIATTPPMPFEMDSTVINLDNFDLFAMDKENQLTVDTNDDFERFLDELDVENLSSSIDSSTFDNFLSSPLGQPNHETLQQLSPSPPVLSPPSTNIPPITNCIRIQSFTPPVLSGPKIIKCESINPNITILKQVVLPTAPLIAVPVVVNDSVPTPVNAITPPIAKRRRSDSPSEQKSQHLFEVPTATVDQLKLQYGNLSDEALRKHIRMIKNRESASLSRKRRKELMENLDVTNKQLQEENSQLKQENSKLKIKIETLEMENKLLKEYAANNHSTSSPPKRNPFILRGLVLLMVVGVGLFQMNSFLPTSMDSSKPVALYGDQTAVVPSRTILESSRSIDQNSYPTNSIYDYGPNGDTSNNNGQAYPYIQCVAYINKTHSQRINQDLRSWVQDQADKIQDGQSAVIPDPKSVVVSSNSAVEKNKGSVIEPLHHMTRKVARQAKIQTVDETELQPYKNHEHNYRDFIHSLNRRNDTLYFVSFKRDNLILPATIQNQTQRPKISLILPASMANLNKSIHVPTNHVPMMKIDCEVEDTKLLFVKRTHIPSSYQNDLFQYYSSAPQATI
ncbi:unnamed protein product [Adineta ricciae]|uniref:BZIP domain-containing protein n=1 Tax=Adineta ricciae TaxID=249248 RepID=A0A813ZD02_ADIRI|nr:unnamed protein product [Adineta ricciae]